MRSVTRRHVLRPRRALGTIEGAGSGRQQLPLVLVTPNPREPHLQTPLVGRTASGPPVLEAKKLQQVVRDRLPRETRARVRPEGREGARDAEIWERVFQPEEAAGTKAQAGGSMVCPPERRPGRLERSEVLRRSLERWRTGQARQDLRLVCGVLDSYSKDGGVSRDEMIRPKCFQRPLHLLGRNQRGENGNREARFRLKTQPLRCLVPRPRLGG